MSKVVRLKQEEAALIVDRLGIILDCIQQQNVAIDRVVLALRKVAAMLESAPKQDDAK